MRVICVLSLEFGDLLQKNKFANTFEIQNYVKYEAVLKINWPQNLIISLSKCFIKQSLSLFVSKTVLAKLRWF